MKIRKRDKSLQEFNFNKVESAINNAFYELGYEEEDLTEILQEIRESIPAIAEDDIVELEELQDLIEEVLMDFGYFNVAKAYILYRNAQAVKREANMIEQVSGLLNQSDEFLMKENANKKPELTNVQQSYLGGIMSTYYCRNKIFTKDVLEAHDSGAIHIHDMDMSAMEAITNCCLMNCYDPLYNGTVLNDTGIDPQTKFVTACTVITQMIQGVAGLQYGGITVTMSDLVPALQMSLNKIKDNAKKYVVAEKQEEYINEIYHRVLSDGIQTFMYQVNSMFTTQGQTPFLTVNLYLNEVSEDNKPLLADIIEEVLEQRIKGFKDRYGNWVAPAFPKLIYVLEEDNITKESKYYYLTKLAAECNARRMVPDYISEKVMKQIHGYCYPSMGCRSFLSPWRNERGEIQFYGRNNLGVVTLNLGYIAAESLKDGVDFFKTLDKYALLAHKAHQIRTKRICNSKVERAPLLWKDGVFTRAEEGTSIGQIVKGGRASVSLGYAGLYECVKFLTGENHWEKGKDFAISIMKKLIEYCETWTQEDDLKYGVYGTPMETGTYKFAKAIKRIKPDYDRLYITNSYHIPVFIEIDPFSKLKIEGEFQKYSKNGCISYIECADLTKNLDVIHQVQECIYDHCMYAELNIKSCKCYSCGSEDPMEIDEDLNWYCPKCGEKRPNKLRHLYRICGYASTNDSNAGRTSDVKDRYIHLDNH